MARNNESKQRASQRPATTAHANKFSADQRHQQKQQQSRLHDRSDEWNDPKSAPPGEDGYVYSEDDDYDGVEYDRSGLNSRQQQQDDENVDPNQEEDHSRQLSSLSAKEKELFSDGILDRNVSNLCFQFHRVFFCFVLFFYC